MDLSPNDIRNYEFPSQMRGYDKEEVDNLLEQVASALEQARQENLKLSMEVDALKTQVSSLKEFEDTIKNAAIDARRNADSLIANARKDAEEFLAKAKTEAEEAIASHKKRIEQVKSQLAELERVKKSYTSELRGIINSHMEMVDEIATADVKKDIHGEVEPTEADSEPAPASPPEEEKELTTPSDSIQVMESTDVTRQEVETLASKGEDQDETGETKDTGEPAAAEPGDEAPPDEISSAVDPELAVALEQYRTEREAKQRQEKPAPAEVPAQGEIVETNRKAEDIPEGFIGKVADVELKDGQAPPEPIPPTASAEDDEVTRKASADGLAPDAQDRPTEHNAIDMDQPTEEDRARQSVSPDELAEALDHAVSKFEEELDKAEKK
ncbi:MAG: DivIVA domain-containing protein [Candidatus Zixiibacteriota bacterium]|nr:MAG: DivIVA domain-containing protein [candidate division Zixibacteria bacterium]